MNKSLEIGVRLNLIVETELVNHEIIAHLGNRWSIAHDDSVMDEDGWYGIMLTSPALQSLDRVIEAVQYIRGHRMIAWNDACSSSITIVGTHKLTIPLSTDELFARMRIGGMPI